MLSSETNETLLFDDVLEMYYDTILRFVLKQVSNIEDAKDLTQEIFIKTYNNFGKYNPKKASIKTWLFHISNNHIINYWRSAYFRSKANTEINLDLLASSDDILESLIQEENVEYILSMMKKYLNKKHCRIMNLYFFSELSTIEIGEILQMNKKTVSNVISLSIKKIKSRLEDNHGKTQKTKFDFTNENQQF